MGLTERHWFEDEEPELTENQLEDILWENNKIFERGYQKGFSDGKSATVGGWISVKDRMPENQNPVIVFVPPHVDEIKGTFLGYVGMAYYTSFGEGFWCGTDGNLYGAIGTIHTPTHWMPRPEPPEEVSRDE